LAPWTEDACADRGAMGSKPLPGASEKQIHRPTGASGAACGGAGEPPRPPLLGFFNL
jgi:hypothetical protein